MIKKVAETLKKLEKVPSFVWIITVIISSFFAETYVFFRELNPAYLKSVFESGMTTSAAYALYLPDLNYTVLWVFVVIGETFLIWGIFELLIGVVFKNMKARRQVVGDGKFFKMIMRIAFSACNLIVGLLCVPCFFGVSSILADVSLGVMQLLLRLVLFTFAYLVCCEVCIFQGAVASAYKRISTFFSIFLLVLSAYDVLILLLSYSSADLAALIIACLELAIVIAYFIIARLVILPKLKARQDKVVEIRFVIKPKNEGEGGSGNQGGFDFDAYFKNGKDNPGLRNENPFAGSESDENYVKPSGGNSSSSNGKSGKDDDEIFKGFGF